jgi:hypothetical protein
MRDTVICVMAKAPRPGQVKTRLCPPLEPDQAAALAAAFLLDTWAAATAACDRVLLARAGARADFPPQLRDAPGFEQRGSDLGARMEHAARTGLDRGARVLVIGSDLPGLPVSHLEDAAARLDQADVVLGPSSDGGFYAIGFEQCPVGCLANIPWSSPHTCERTVARLRQVGLEVSEGLPFDDVDDIEGLSRLREALEAGRVSTPATAAALRAIPWSSRSSYPS